MEKVVMYDPGLCSFNRGDEIISNAVYDGLSEFLADKYVTSISSHMAFNKVYVGYLMDYDYKFVCGSNLLMGKMNGRFRQWDISRKSIPAVQDCILVGVGWWQPNDNPNFYTKNLYNTILNKKYKHSVRDEYTKTMLNSIGITNVINTGCATMWKFTPEFCREIPTGKADSVVFTLTGYSKDPAKDKTLVEILLKNYGKVYYWPQGIGDWDYLVSLGYADKVTVLGNTLADYDQFLSEVDCDYVGTRLHGGIRALQYKRRSIILAVDNRAREKKKDFDIPCVERDEIESVEKMLTSSFETSIKIPLERINEWKSQFKV